jgi:hypothetical protein
MACPYTEHWVTTVSSPCSSLRTRDLVIDLLSDGCAVPLAPFTPGHALCVVSSEGSAMRVRHVVETSTTYGGLAPCPSRTPRGEKRVGGGSRREIWFQHGFSSNPLSTLPSQPSDTAQWDLLFSERRFLPLRLLQAYVARRGREGRTTESDAVRTTNPSDGS